MSVLDLAPAPSVLIEELRTALTAMDIVAHMVQDPLLAQVLDWVGRRWPLRQVAKQFVPFWVQQLKLSIQQGCLL